MFTVATVEDNTWDADVMCEKIGGSWMIFVVEEILFFPTYPHIPILW